ncbi:TIR domain-containing protein [Celeribacter sp. HF31]|uniref:TIR domain-containing protein n=1 Tax=Celeribacter sp. HF31 TaxID=2721558 RepID=UPI00142F6356|nr:TIR domain-containing protein [Celeribacter sp. HF31]NIY81070.1 TIR domain-containing protein [Celeribacter sp. HF31]
MSEIFISHAVADKILAKALVSFLKEAIGVPEKSIFCSSVEGHGIPLGADFNDYMKGKIQKPKLVILLITETYLERHFCLMELGAAWARSLNACPIVVGDVPFETVTNTIGLKQAWKISNHSGLNDFKKLIVDTGIELEQRGPHVWDDKRTEWRAKLSKTLPKLPKGTMATRQELDKANDVASSLREIISDLEGQLDRASSQIDALKACKDAEQVKDILKEFSDHSKNEEFEQLLENLSDARPSGVWSGVYLHILLDYFDLSGQIDWFNDKNEFTTAIQYKLISEDAGHPVLWGTKKLKKVETALKALSAFLEDPENEKFISAREDQDVPMEIADREFFEFHLKL